MVFGGGGGGGGAYASWSALQECQETSESNSEVKKCKPLSLVQTARREHLQVQRSERVTQCGPASLWQRARWRPMCSSHVVKPNKPLGGVNFGKAEQSGEAGGRFLFSAKCRATVTFGKPLTTEDVACFLSLQ